MIINTYYTWENDDTACLTWQYPPGGHFPVDAINAVLATFYNAERQPYLYIVYNEHDKHKGLLVAENLDVEKDEIRALYDTIIEENKMVDHVKPWVDDFDVCTWSNRVDDMAAIEWVCPEGTTFPVDPINNIMAFAFYGREREDGEFLKPFLYVARDDDGEQIGLVLAENLDLGASAEENQRTIRDLYWRLIHDDQHNPQEVPWLTKIWRI